MNVVLLKFLALVMGFALWAALGYLKLVPLDPLIALLQMGLGGLITHMLQADPQPQMAPLAPVAPPAQGGFARLGVIFILAVLALVVACSGCASLTDAGHTAYSFEPVMGADGKATGGCKFSATDGKEFSARSIVATSSTEGCQVMVQEGASTAFQGQAIAGKALSVLPSFAPILMPIGPATTATVPKDVPLPPNPPAEVPPKL